MKSKRSRKSRVIKSSSDNQPEAVNDEKVTPVVEVGQDPGYCLRENDMDEGLVTDMTKSVPSKRKGPKRKVKAKSRSEVKRFVKRGMEKNPKERGTPLKKLNERLFSGQYVKLMKLSTKLIEEKLRCSLKSYLQVKGKITVADALRNYSYKGVRRSSEEKSQLQLLLPKKEPLPEVQEVKLRCAFCPEEFQDYDQRVKHYGAHVSGTSRYPRSPPPSPAPCAGQSLTQWRREGVITRLATV